MISLSITPFYGTEALTNSSSPVTQIHLITRYSSLWALWTPLSCTGSWSTRQTENTVVVPNGESGGMVQITGDQGGQFSHLSGRDCSETADFWPWKNPADVSVIGREREVFDKCFLLLMFLHGGGWKGPVAITKGRICCDLIIQQIFTWTLSNICWTQMSTQCAGYRGGREPWWLP